VVKSLRAPDAPVVTAARERGLEVTGELELAWRLISNAFCAVTGTNGKTTTTELVGHLYRTAGQPVAVAGNVGTPLASLVGAIDPDATVACEASSFQLEDTSYFGPECGVFLNLAPTTRPPDPRAAPRRSCGSRQSGQRRLRRHNGQTPEPVAATRRLRAPVRFARANRRRDPDCELSMRDGVTFAVDEPLLRADERPLEPTTSRTPCGGGRRTRLRLPRDAVAEGLRTFQGFATARAGRRAQWGCSTSMTWKATNVASALAGINASTAASG
jgi:UDP-N-acetylmuramoylalanine--D-glutamate ligase